MEPVTIAKNDSDSDSANNSDSRYELSIDGKVIGFAGYRDEAAHRVFTHTEVDAEHRGKGLASKIIRYALDDTRAAGKRALAQCPMVADYVAKHHEWDDVLDTSAA